MSIACEFDIYQTRPTEGGVGPAGPARTAEGFFPWPAERIWLPGFGMEP